MYGKCVALQLPYSAVKMDVYIGEGGQSHASGLVLERGGLKGEEMQEKKMMLRLGDTDTKIRGRGGWVTMTKRYTTSPRPGSFWTLGERREMTEGQARSWTKNRCLEFDVCGDIKNAARKGAGAATIHIGL